MGGVKFKMATVHPIEWSISLNIGNDKVSILTNFGVLVILVILMRTLAT